MPVRRKHFLAAAAGGAFAGIAFPRYPANAAEFSYKFSTENPASHHMTQRWVECAAKVLEESNGRMEIRVFPNSALGGQSQQLSQTRLGAIEFSSGADFILANVVPVAGITTTPFIFTSAKDALGAMSGPLGRYRRAAVEKAGLYAFPRSWDEGFRHVVDNVRSINVPDDLKALKIRTPDSPVVVQLFKAFGATPASLSSNEMYLAIQTKVVDGAESVLAAVESHKLYEVTKYASYTYHMWSSYTMVANAAAWQKLPKDLRDVVERNVDKYGDLSNGDTLRLDSSIEATLTGQGMTFNKANVAAFQSAVKKSGIYAQMRESYGAEAWALLEKSVGRLS